jgi:hypothetical protein
MGEDQRIFRLRYVGARFLGARLPLDVIADLPAFRDLLVSYAKDRWRASNPDRRRLPKGFDQSISFDLIRIEDGSAAPALAWNRQIAQTSLEGFTDELEDIVDHSYMDVEGLFADAGIGKFPRVLSSDKIRALNRFGAGLHEGERIEFPSDRHSNDNVPYLDTTRRKSIITRVRDTYELRYEGIGYLSGTHVQLSDHDAAGQIKVVTEGHGELSIALSSDRIRDEFDGSIESAVQFALQIEMDNQDRIQRVVDVFDIELIDPEQWEAILRCRQRLGQLKGLETGWHDGGGDSISATAIASAGSFLDKRPSLARIYKIYPMDSRGVSVEIEVKGWDYSIDFLPEGGLEFYGVEIDGKDELELKSYSAATDPAFLDSFDARTRN